MKTDLKISIFAIVSVLCTSVAATAASSVRTLGGAGTYSSASSAAAANDSAVKPATRVSTASRGGSVRVNTAASDTERNTVALQAGSASGGRVSATPRLSIGKYLGGGTSVSGNTYVRPQGGSSSSGGSMAPGGATAEAVEELRELLAEKQDLLTAGTYIEISSNGDIDIRYDDLANELAARFGVEASDFAFQLSGGELQFQFKGGAWQPIVSVDEIIAAGNVYTKDETYNKTEVENLLRNAEVDLSAYSTTDEIAALYATTTAMNTAIDTAVSGLEAADAGLVTRIEALEGQGGNTGAAITALQTKIGTGALPAEEGFEDLTAAVNTLMQSDMEFMVEANTRFEETDAVVDANTKAIADETTARTNADASLQSQITALSTQGGNADAAIVALQATDTGLQGAIDTERTERIAADATTLQSAKDYADGKFQTVENLTQTVNLTEGAASAEKYTSEAAVAGVVNEINSVAGNAAAEILALQNKDVALEEELAEVSGLTTDAAESAASALETAGNANTTAGEAKAEASSALAAANNAVQASNTASADAAAAKTSAENAAASAASAEGTANLAKEAADQATSNVTQVQSDVQSINQTLNNKIDKGAVTGADVVDGTIEKIDLATPVQTSLDKADVSISISPDAVMDAGTPYLLMVQDGVVTPVSIADTYVSDTTVTE